MLLVIFSLLYSTIVSVPYATETATPQPASFLEELDSIDLMAIGLSNNCCGVAFDGTYLWVSDGQCMLHLITLEGVLVSSFAQGGVSGWGLRDLCYDGSFIYGSASTRVDFYHTGTYEWLGSYYCNAVSPNRAQAYDGTYFYTGSFSECIYQVNWDGVPGSTATYTLWSTAVFNGGTYGAAWDAYNNCLWVSTASSDGMLFQIDADGFLISVYYTGLMATGCSGGNVTGYPAPPWPLYKALWIMDNSSSSVLRAYELMPDIPLDRLTWGSIKVLF